MQVSDKNFCSGKWHTVFFVPKMQKYLSNYV
nr:MAG TPA: hypothetical protein [Caudoviricetes sp.]